MIAAWRPAVRPGPHREWVERVTDALAPGALPGGYPNILGPDDAERARLGFGANADRLLAAKRRYDPDGVLTAIASLAT